VQGHIDQATNRSEYSGIWVFACPQHPTFDCIPTQALRSYHANTDTYDPTWDWFVLLPMKPGDEMDVTIVFCHTADPQSAFGYYSTVSGFTTDPAQASLIHLKIGGQFDAGMLEIPDSDLPPTFTPTPAP